MKRMLALTVGVAVTVLSLAPLTWAGDVQGKIKSVDPMKHQVILEDGTQLMIPPDVKVDRAVLRPGADVKASFEEQGQDKVVTAIELRPAQQK